MTPTCLHEHLMRHGYERNGCPRYRCKSCGQTFTQGPNLQLRKRMTIGKALLAPGSTVRKVAKDCNACQKTVKKVRKILLPYLPSCPCGKPQGHRGWCAWRISRSPAKNGISDTLEHYDT